MRLQIFGLLCLLWCQFIFTSCQKNAAPVQQTLTENEKTEFIAKVRADTLYKQWRTSQKEAYDLMRLAVRTGKIDTTMIKAFKPTGKEEDHIRMLKAAGVFNAEEYDAASKRSKELLKELWRKYPELNKLSFEDIVGLGKKESGMIQ